jgi:hypothetical protein
MKPDETKSDQATPEQLLNMLDDQISIQRKRKKNSATRRAILLTVGLLVILGGLLGSMMLFQHMAQDLQRSPKKAPGAVAE